MMGTYLLRDLDKNSNPDFNSPEMLLIYHLSKFLRARLKVVINFAFACTDEGTGSRLYAEQSLDHITCSDPRGRGEGGI